MTGPARPFVALTAIALVEGAALLGYGLYDLVQAVRVGVTGPADVSNVPALVIQIAIFLLFGLALLWVAQGWWRVRRRARAPFLLAQFFALVVGIPLAQASGSVERVVGIALCLMAGIGIALTFTPAVMHALED